MKPLAATFASALALLVLSVSAAHAADTGAASAQDANFATLAAAGGIAEVKFGETAAEQAESMAVKQFGQQMVQDHTLANAQLMAIAQQLNLDAPKDMDRMHKDLHDKIEDMKGAEFDRAYMQSQVQDHQTQIALFEQEAAQGQTPQLKAFATQTLPKLQQHYQMALQVQQSLAMGSGARGGATPAGASQ